ncbi:MAG: hypothetical protein IT437_00520 [Phycisphaerales bacterium]|nr:hypothetical protein [Phycisphaerales bacterium]
MPRLPAPVLFASLALSACSTTPRGEPFRAEIADPAQGVLYVFRERGRGPGIDVTIDQESMGSLRPGAYIAAVLPPGDHFVRASGKSETTRLVHLAPGESAYLRITTPGMTPRRPDIDQPETARARAMIAKTVRVEAK